MFNLSYLLVIETVILVAIIFFLLLIKRAVRQKQAKKLEALRSEVARAKKSQNQFLSGINHEIRTPLHGIMGMNELLKQTTLTSKQRQFVIAIGEASETLNLLIGDLLDLVKIEAGGLVLQHIKFCLKEVVSQAASGWEKKAKEKGLDWKVEIDPKIPTPCIGDPLRLKQVLNNLLSNAVKFTKKGEVRLKVSVKTLEKEKVLVELLVEDTGIGIPENTLPELFKKFVQADKGGKKRNKGTGIGLTIAKKLLELQQGNIKAISRVGYGSTFTATIPFSYAIDHSADKVANENTQFAPDLLSNIQVIIVEDNLINQKVAKYTVQKFGAGVTIANNGKEAVAILQKDKLPDIILMDISMPEMDGYELTDFIRHNLKLKVPIIAMTATIREEEKKKCFEIGVNEYLSKPFTEKILIEAMQNLLLANGTLTQEETNNPVVFSKTNQTKHYDLAYLEELEDDNYKKDILEDFLAITPPAFEELKTEIKNKNWTAVHEKAHKLKSSLGLLQAQPLLDWITQIELNAKENKDIDKIPELMRNAFSEYKIVSDELQKELKTIL